MNGVLSEDHIGLCEELPEELGGVISIQSNVVGVNLIDVLVHEWLHALLPFAKEEWVDTNATELAELLTDKEVITKIGLFNKVIYLGEDDG